MLHDVACCCMMLHDVACMCLLAPHAMSRGLPYPLLAARNDFVSQIEVNRPPRIDASLSETEDATYSQAEASVAPELDTFDTDVSQWAIFQASQAKLSESEREELEESTVPTAAPSQGDSGHGNENLENKMNKCSLGCTGLEALSSQCSRDQMRMVAVASDSLLPERLLLFPYDILNRLHRSHLAQLDELWALRTLQQRRQLNVQKSTFLKETCSLVV